MAGHTFGKAGVVKPVFLPIIRDVAVGTLARIMVGPVMTIYAFGVAGMVNEYLIPGSCAVTPRALPLVMPQRRFISMALDTIISVNMVERDDQPIVGDMASATSEIGVMIGGTKMALLTIGQADMIERGLLPVCY